VPNDHKDAIDRNLVPRLVLLAAWGEPDGSQGGTLALCLEDNPLPQSITRRVEEGDVRGVLEIIRPLHRDVRRTRDGLRGTFVLVAFVAGSLLALSVLILVVGPRQHGLTGPGRKAQ
jgi:hypothetical protein